VGTTFDLFDWQGADVSGQFAQVVVPPGTQWDTADLYTTGQVTLAAGVFSLTSVRDGAWDAAETWGAGMVVPTQHHTVVIQTSDVLLSGSGQSRSFETRDAARLTLAPQSTLAVAEDLALSDSTLSIRAGSQLHVGGDAVFGQRATLVVELADDAATPFITEGTVALSDTDTVLELQWGGPTGPPGTRAYTIVDASAGITGAFAQTPPVEGNGSHLGRGAFLRAVDYGPAVLAVDVFQAIAGDTDGNRDVNGFDIQAILSANKFGTFEAADWTEGDFTSDGFVNGFDIQALLSANQFGKGPYASQDSPGAMATVPEPGTIAMLLAGTLCLAGIAWRRRRI
jgi:hypothetical protein